MLKFLFNHRSRTVDVVEALGVIALAASAWRAIEIGAGWFTWTCIIIVLLEYSFIRYCTSVRWYRNSLRFEGVELQFKKAMSPTVYILLVGGIFFQIIPSAIILAIMAVLLAIIGHANVIIIYLHQRDHDSTPPNYFSHNKAL